MKSRDKYHIALVLFGADVLGIAWVPQLKSEAGRADPEALCDDQLIVRSLRELPVPKQTKIDLLSLLCEC